jgi:hypothetical protein
MFGPTEGDAVPPRMAALLAVGASVLRLGVRFSWLVQPAACAQSGSVNALVKEVCAVLP